MELTLENFTITWEPLELEGKSKIPENLKVHLQKLYKEIESPKPTTIDKIRRLIKKYPRSVQLKNYLSSTYNALGNTKKAREINDVMLKKHPDYLFAKINKANHYADVEEFEKMTDILGKGFDLKTLYPDREVFHISEFMVMHQTAVRYYLGKDDFDQAQKRIDLMKKVDEDAPQYQQAQEYYSFALMQMVRKRYKEEEKKRITPKNKFHLNTKKFELPEFNFKQTYDLYAYEMDLPDALIDEFLAFDRSKAIEDLENVLKDSYFNFDKNETGESDFAAVHALLLLAEMKAEESLPVVLEMMQQDQDYFDEIFGEIFTEAGWMPLMKLGKNQLGALADFLKLPGLHTYFRSAVIDVLVQIIHHYPEKKSGVLQVFEEVLNFLTTAKIEDNVIDTEFNGFIVWDLTELKLVQFLPQIKQLYEKAYVNPGVCGTYENIAKDIKNPDHFPSKKRKLMDIKKLYNDFFVPVEEDPGPNYFEEKQTPIVNTKKKIGRNDPCPCGSGKKYKKCCLRKGVFE